MLIADLNGRYGSAEYHARIAEAIEAIIALEPEAVVIAGDMIAGQVKPALSNERIAAMWENFEQVVYRPLKEKGIEVLAVPGNHDASIYPAYSHERQAYDPDVVSATNDSFSLTRSNGSVSPLTVSMDFDSGTTNWAVTGRVRRMTSSGFSWRRTCPCIPSPSGGMSRSSAAACVRSPAKSGCRGTITRFMRVWIPVED